MRVEAQGQQVEELGGPCDASGDRWWPWWDPGRDGGHEQIWNICDHCVTRSSHTLAPPALGQRARVSPSPSSVHTQGWHPHRKVAVGSLALSGVKKKPNLPQEPWEVGRGKS